MGLCCSQGWEQGMKKLAAIFLVLMLCFLASVLGVGWALGRPVPAYVGDPPADLNAQCVEFKSDSGSLVKGWWCLGRAGKGTILLLPGIRANRLSMVDRARFLQNAGYSVLLIDFQATGETKGDHITFGWKESRDVLAAVRFIRQIRPSDRIGIIGSSLGGAAALIARPPVKINALVVEAVYPTIETVVQNRLDNYLGPLGRLAAPLLLAQLKPRLGISASDLRPVDRISCVGCPIFVMSGENDRNTRRHDTNELYSRARDPKQMWFVPKAAHVDLHAAAAIEYESRVLSFFDQTVATKSE
jgi:fermentation-respiration switch protein FrsA (DUF1100 family)